ncbi:MAG: N-6 DNA methylase [Candidatus Gastranaerophilaceae bacterium]
MQKLISKATEKNWKRLNLQKEDIEKKLTSRANKKLSSKKITPFEYIEQKNTGEILQGLLSLGKMEDILYSMAINLLEKNDLISFNNNEIHSKNKYLIKILNQFNQKAIKEIIEAELPDSERDLLGITYQMYLSEGSKNKSGSYYTPQKILDSIISKIKPNDKFLDPCCGGGSFLLAAADIIDNPENIYGCDIDKNACFIAKINLILKYRDKIFDPKIICTDFLENNPILPQFDIIATNPPWGAVTQTAKIKEIQSGESFSCFIVKASKYIKDDGKMFFILPEAILNVKTHKDIRKFILDNFQIDKIEIFGHVFSAVLSDVISLHLSKTKKDNIIIKTKDNTFNLAQKYYKSNTNNVFSIMDNLDAEILEKIYSTPHIKLDLNSTWGLGIVTGNNAKFISKNNIGEKIYTGKNIKKNEITESDYYINYDRKNFQQCAPEGIYRAKEKLVYKFISKELIFAYDDKQRLFLNSANILIPKLSGYNIKTVMTVLNSQLFQYIYSKKFSGLKVLKSSLMELPFPILNNNDTTEEDIFKYFNLAKNEIEHILTSK